MGTSKERLKEKHANKNKNVVQIFDSEKSVGFQMVNLGPEVKDRKSASDAFHGIPLSEKERNYFSMVYEQLKQVHEVGHEKYLLACANLAKLYAQEEILENILLADGLILEEVKTGHLYSHPAARLLQQVQAGIIRNLTSLGLTLGKKKIEDKDKPMTESEFAQFNF